MRSTAIVCLLPLILARGGFSTEPTRPNFVVIFSDDHTFRAVGYHNPQVRTPHLDDLVSRGFRCNRCFVASPICVASRASLYSGVYPQQHGSVGLDGRGFAQSVIEEHRYPALAEVLGRAGYHTALYGKSHLGNPQRFGFAEGREIADRNDIDTFREARNFLERPENHARPFLLVLTPHNPHLPLTAPQLFLDQYAGVDITLDPNFRERPESSSLFNQGLPGLASSGNELGDKTAQLKTGPQMQITGTESDSGDVDVETMSTSEQQQETIRQYREKVDKYEQLSESALDSEPIPLGHRQTIRRYFELIRPQNSETP